MLRDRRGKLRVQSMPILTGRDVATAQVGFDAARRPTLRIRLTRDGANALAFYIDGHVDFRGAVVLDGKVLSTPVLDGKMEDSGEIDLHGNLGSDAEKVAARIQRIADSEGAGVR
jgi:preprotein translocase subunit SecD